MERICWKWEKDEKEGGKKMWIYVYMDEWVILDWSLEGGLVFCTFRFIETYLYSCLFRVMIMIACQHLVLLSICLPYYSKLNTIKIKNEINKLTKYKYRLRRRDIRLKRILWWKWRLCPSRFQTHATLTWTWRKHTVKHKAHRAHGYYTTGKHRRRQNHEICRPLIIS